MNHPIQYILHLADTALILSQRNSEWCGHGPILEQDIAITNISLDLLGQARYFYQHAADLLNKENNNTSATEDGLAYLRKEREFKNLLITELPNGDWGQTILRQFFISALHSLLYKELAKSKDPQLAAIANKSIKEVAYHLKWSSEWVMRLGDGTAESNQRMKYALEVLSPYVGEFFIPVDFEKQAAADGIGINPEELKEEWHKLVKEVLAEAGLEFPQQAFAQTGGKTGIHTEHLGYILAELQYMQRTYPGSEW